MLDKEKLMADLRERVEELRVSRESMTPYTNLWVATGRHIADLQTLLIGIGAGTWDKRG